MWALAPQASVSAVPPLRHIIWRAARDSSRLNLLRKHELSSVRADGAVRIDHHQYEERDQEHHRTDDGDPIQVLLDDAGAGLRRVHGAGDGI